MLKLIPHEESNGKSANNHNQGRRKKGRAPLIATNQQQYFFEVKDQNGKLKKICIRLIKYVKGEKHSTQEVSEMIHDLQESILCLEKQKKQILWSKKKK